MREKNKKGILETSKRLTQETQREHMTLEQVSIRLQERMQEKFAKVLAYSRDNNVTMRQAAMDIAVGRVVEAVSARGILP